MTDVSLPCGHNISSKGFDKLRKYKDFLINIEKLRYQDGYKTGDCRNTWSDQKGRENHLRVIPSQPTIQDAQKVVLTINWSHVLWIFYPFQPFNVFFSVFNSVPFHLQVAEWGMMWTKRRRLLQKSLGKWRWVRV